MGGHPISARAPDRDRVPPTPGGGTAVRLLAVLLLVGCRAAPPKEEARPDRPPSIVLYLIDTLRADHLGCLGDPRSITPQIDAFARDADLVTTAVAQAPWTRPSVATILTGLNPLAHGVNSREAALPPDTATLPGLLRRQGYRTAAFITNDQVGRIFGFDRGFDEFTELQGTDPYLRRSSRHVADAAREWLRQHRDDQRPFFLYLHTIDPHAPYLPPAGQRQQFAPKVLERKLETRQVRAIRKLLKRTKGDPSKAVMKLRVGSVPWIMGLSNGLIDIDERMLSDLRNLYAGEVAANDEQLGALLETLREMGLYDDSLVIVVSDHGEEFLEHGGWQHGKTLYSEVLEVPLLVKLPRGDGAVPDRRLLPAQHVDLLPTVLDRAGLEPPPELAGRVLFVDRATDEEEPSRPRPAISYLEYDGQRSRSYLEGSWKLIRIEGRRDRTLLFDLDRDPLERADVSGELTELAAALAQRLDALSTPSGRRSHTVELDGETDRRLNALGYL